MYAIVTDNEITKFITNPKSMVIGDVRYPAKIFQLWSTSELNAIGIYEVVFDDSNKKDEKWYINTNQSFAFADNKVTASYGSASAKKHADTTWTQAQIDDASLVGQAPDGADTNTVRLEGLKTVLIRAVKVQAETELNKTDWYVTRKSEKGTAIPSDIQTERDGLREECNDHETAINAKTTKAQVASYDLPSII